MALVPVGIPVMQRCCISILLALQLSAFAWSDDCQIAGGTCASEHAVPGMGEALLQHSAKRDQVLLETKIPGRRHRQAWAKSMIQTIFEGTIGGDFPADAKKLFNEKLCKVKPAPKKTSPELQAAAKDEGGQPDKALGKEGAHDFDDPGPEDLPEDADHDKEAPKFEVADAEASHIAHGKEAESEFDKEDKAHEADDNVQEDKDKDDDKDKDKEYGNDWDKEQGKIKDKGTDKDKGKDEEKENGTENAGNDKVSHPQTASPQSHKHFKVSLLQSPFGESKSGSEPQEPKKRSLFSKWDDIDSVQAPLNQRGFKQVQELNSESEMAMFIRRVADSCSLKIIDDGGLNGAVGWFSNTTDTTFDKLKVGMFKALLAASKDHWVSVKKSELTGITAENAPLDLVGYVQVRALRKKQAMINFVRRMVKDMGIKITDPAGFKGLMVYYSEPDDSESFSRLVSEIKKAAYEHSWAELE